MRKLRQIHESDEKDGAFIVADFIKQLKVYDHSGVTCAKNLKEIYCNPDSSDEFIKKLSGGLME